MRAVIYPRGRDLTRQQQDCRALAVERGWEVVAAGAGSRRVS
jgi:hypothetical protein